MLSKILYDLSLLLSSPYSETTSVIKSISNNTLEEIYAKNSFNLRWSEKLNSLPKKFNCEYNYSVIDQNLKFIKVKLHIKKSFIPKSVPNNITSCCTDKYIAIVEYLNERFKIQFLVNKEENPALYKETLTYDLDQIESLLSSPSKNLWNHKLTNINELYEDFMSHTSFSHGNRIRERSSTNFNILAACDYAEQFALVPNPQYKVFDGIGGDCTNFISQIIHAGGIPLTNTWKPYTHAWIRVQEFYWYLTFQGIGFKLPKEYPLSKGDIIQFYTPKLGHFFHTGFITYELDNDYLYCCHSYNKLNYPLSAIYPIIYPELRAIRIKSS